MDIAVRWRENLVAKHWRFFVSFLPRRLKPAKHVTPPPPCPRQWYPWFFPTRRNASGRSVRGAGMSTGGRGDGDVVDHVRASPHQYVCSAVLAMTAGCEICGFYDCGCLMPWRSRGPDRRTASSPSSPARFLPSNVTFCSRPSPQAP